MHRREGVIVESDWEIDGMLLSLDMVGVRCFVYVFGFVPFLFLFFSLLLQHQIIDGVLNLSVATEPLRRATLHTLAQSGWLCDVGPSKSQS